jgi:hypothetical protein
MDPRLPADERRQQQAALLEEMRRHTQTLAAALGAGHMLVQGAGRYQAQLAVMWGAQP